ncbi:MAG: alpha-glucuronidase family glycosyl hydrolase [Planctomycetota bacterium]
MNRKNSYQQNHGKFANSTLIIISALTLFCVLIPTVCKAAGKTEKLITNKSFLLADSDKVSCVIIVSPKNKLCTNAAENLQSYIKKVCGVTPKIKKGVPKENLPENITYIVIGKADDFKNLNDIELPKELCKINRDGFILKTIASKKRNYILTLGRQEKGAVNATWRLIRELNINKKAISADNLDIALSPFIKIREVMLCDPWKAPMNETLKKKYCPRNWSIERLQNYMDMYDSFGYNALQFHDLDYFHVSVAAKGVTLADWRKKLIAMCNQAHSNGQQVNLFMWGGALYYPQWSKKSYAVARFHVPQLREKMLAEYDRQAGLAPYIDRVHTHWVDPGGCRKCKICTIKTPQQYHNVIVDKFRAKNPDIQASFSLWWMNEHLCSWPGFKDLKSSILEAGILPNDTIMAVAPRLTKQNLEKVKLIANAGYKAASWSWRVADWELANGLHSHANTIENYFRSLPTDVGKNLEWHSVGCISQFLVMSNLYVTAQLMWDPQKSGWQALKEFNRGMFARANEDKMTSIMNNIEVGFNCGDCLNGHGNTLKKELLENAPQRLKMLEKAKADLNTIKIADDFVPVFPTVVEPKEFIKEMAVQLDDMILYVKFQIAAKELLKMQEKGASKEQLKKAYQALPEIPLPDKYLTKNAHSIWHKRALLILRQKLGLMTGPVPIWMKPKPARNL